MSSSWKDADGSGLDQQRPGGALPVSATHGAAGGRHGFGSCASSDDDRICRQHQAKM